MNFPISSRLAAVRGLLSATLFCVLCVSAVAQAPKSLVPAFGNEGAEFTTKAKDGNTVKGWLPKEWQDNTEWAPVTATYTKLTDSPDKNVAAVRIKTEKVEEGGQLQLTTYAGIQKFKKGTKYIVTGWVRSSSSTSANVGVRQMSDPYEFYHEQELPAGREWKKFEFSFTPSMDLQAFLMFIVRDVGTVDLAGLAVEEKP